MTAFDKPTDPDPSEQMCARIEEVLEQSAVPIRPLSGSIVNVVHTVRCGERELIAKSGAGEGIRREAAVLTMLRETKVPVPHAVLLPANPTFPNDLLLLEVLPGYAAEPDSDVLTDAGESLRRLHDMELPGFGLIGTVHERPTGVFDTWVNFLATVLADARQTIPVDVLPVAAHDEVAAHLGRRRIHAHLAGVGRGILLHGDLMPKHVWSSEGHLAALIDWGDATVGDPLFDLARFSMAGQEAFQKFLKGYGNATPPDAYLLSFYRMVWSLMALTVECGAGGDWVDGYRSTVRRELGFLQRFVDQGGHP
ncbi:phosphotransferase family protein [Streptomyces sp. WAC05858]|uniref:phosphotransferase family protein n=1 Tax=Streptomyces TaxID=1883 RepID=UPI000F79C651|nr:aminoglycoside phosphotransferase family protein [Streptomyces sp. WAC05858]RSS35056.1 aminoglycoside phosphotransferase family protein [Streptomyces sp. WAC05858]WTB04022.1 aminoglycoside phosphotransferase family protein [Streptomyces antimycoticus]